MENDDYDFTVPAATVEDLDFSFVDPTVAAEIRRLGQLMNDGEETEEEFVRLIRMVHEAGFTVKGESLLRVNMMGVPDGRAMYLELYGTEKPDAYSTAIAAFQSQFELTLSFVKETDFLIHEYECVPHGDCLVRPELLSEPCILMFCYGDEDIVEAHVNVSSDINRFAVLLWDNSEWIASGDDDE